MSVTDRLLANNAVYAQEFNGPLPLPPALGVAVVACMDARLNVYGILGCEEGQAHVIRVARNGSLSTKASLTKTSRFERRTISATLAKHRNLVRTSSTSSHFFSKTIWGNAWNRAYPSPRCVLFGQIIS